MKSDFLITFADSDWNHPLNHQAKSQQGVYFANFRNTRKTLSHNPVIPNWDKICGMLSNMPFKKRGGVGGTEGFIWEKAISYRLSNLFISRQEKGKITLVPVVTILSVLNLIPELRSQSSSQQQAFRWQLNL